MNNVWKTLGAGLSVAVLLTVSVLSVAASAPIIVNDSPAGAAYIDNLPHSVDISKSAWYRFDYQTTLRASDRSPIYLTLVNGNNTGVEMDVYTFDQVNDDLADQTENWRAENPVGRGTAQHYNCSNHLPRVDGDCISNNLTWVGTFANSGTVYVRIRNTNLYPTAFTLTVEGATVSLTPSSNSQYAMHDQ
jgi:hypothetical protein